MLDSSLGMNKTGNGLGLNLCQKLVRAMGGDIAFVSEPKIYTTFTFWVPCVVSKPSNQNNEIITKTYSHRELHLLNIDDEYLNLCVLDSYANKYCIAYSSFLHAKEALSKIEDGSINPTIAFIDINMPEISRYDVERRLRCMKLNIALVALTERTHKAFTINTKWLDLMKFLKNLFHMKNIGNASTS